MKIMKNIKILGMFLVGMLFLGVMTPNVAFATNNVNGGKDFGDRFTMNDGKLSDSGADGQSTDSTFNTIFEEYRNVIAGVSGVVAITMLLLFIIQAFRLGSSAHNASERQKAIQGMIWLGIATAIAGSVSLFAGLFYGMLA